MAALLFAFGFWLFTQGASAGFRIGGMMCIIIAGLMTIYNIARRQDLEERIQKLENKIFKKDRDN